MSNMENEELNKNLLAIAERYRAVSISMCAFRDGTLIYSDAFGMRDPENGLPANTDTVYRSASVSKHVSAITAMTLFDRGLFDPDEDIGKYLGYRVRNPYYPDTPITGRQLMNFTSTLHERGTYNRILAGELPPYKLSEILDENGPGYSKENFGRTRPGEVSDYSSFCIGILGTIVEKITGKRFAAYAKEAVLDPLGIRGSFDPRDLTSYDIAVPYEIRSANEKTRPYGDAEASEPGWMKKSLENKLKLMDLPVGESYRTAQGNLYIVPQDLMKISMILLDGGISCGKRILSGKAVKEILTPLIREKNIGLDIGLCIGLTRDFDEGSLTFGFSGRAFGALNSFMLRPSDKSGAICYCNGAESTGYRFGAADICADILQAIYNRLLK